MDDDIGWLGGWEGYRVAWIDRRSGSCPEVWIYLSPVADGPTLLRRLCLDLTGLPPTLRQLGWAEKLPRADAYQKVVDELIDSPHYGEHWARWWLDAAGYADSLSTAETLRESIGTLIEEPSADALQGAKDAWLAARVPYQQTEVYRFGNPLVDAWEGKVNAWPLDEGLIDYVDASYGNESEENGLYTANVVANESLSIDGREIDASTITREHAEHFCPW